MEPWISHCRFQTTHLMYDPPSPCEKSLASNCSGYQWASACTFCDGWSKNGESWELPAQTSQLGGAQCVSNCIVGTMADLDASSLPLSGHYPISRQTSDPSVAEGSETSITDDQRGRTNRSSRYITDDTTRSKLPSPLEETGSVKKPRHPRKPRSADTITRTSPRDAASKPGCRTNTKFGGETCGPNKSKMLRTREKNRIAAHRCRLRRREEEAKLKSWHDELERKHRSLLDAQSELILKIHALKVLMMSHTSCDCQLIRDYLTKTASEWVAKKTEASTSTVGTSPLRSER